MAQRYSVSATDGGSSSGSSSGNSSRGDSNVGANVGTNVGIRFNQVQREEPAAIVLTPQVDPALRRRRVVFVALAVAAALLLLLVSINRLGVQTSGAQSSNRSFQRPPQEIQ